VTIYFRARVTQHTNAPNSHTNYVSVNGFYSQCQYTGGNLNVSDGTCPCESIDNCNQVYGVTDIATDQANDLTDNVTVWIYGIDVTKYAITNSTLQAGDIVVFHITVRNTGDLKICNITVHDRLPSALEFVNSSPENSSPVTGRDVYINLGCLDGNSSTTINITTKVSTNATPDSSLINYVEVNGTVYDNNDNPIINVSDNYTTPPQYYDNETGTYQTPSIGKAKLSLKKIALDPWTRPNREISYQVEADTGGSNIMAYEVTIYDTLPTGFQFMDNIQRIEGNCNPTSNNSNGTTGTITFYLGDFSGKCIFTYTVYVPWNTKDGYYRNNQTLIAKDKNNNTLANVTDDAVVIVNSNAKLTVNKDVINPRIFQPNDIITYSLTISNEGDNEIHDVNVTDIIPYGMNYSSSWIDNTVYIPGYNEVPIGSPACSIISQSCNGTHCNVTVGCCNNEIYTINDLADGSSQFRQVCDGNCYYNVSCNISNSPECTISSCTSTMQIIGDSRYTNSSKGYKAIWHFDSIPPKTTKIIYLNLTITSDSVSGSSMNKVEVEGITPNGDKLIWKDIASSARIGKAQLILEKFSDSATVAAGEDVSYTIFIKNIGEGSAQNLSIIDTPGSQMQLGKITSAMCNGQPVDAANLIGGPASNYGEPVTYILKDVILEPGKYCEIHYKASTATTAQEGLYINTVELNWMDMFGTEQMPLKTSAPV
ncbi:MAG: hypothetical protein ACK4YO_02615, partial [Candidatus Altarchaeaceae archaeon]